MKSIISMIILLSISFNSLKINLKRENFGNYKENYLKEILNHHDDIKFNNKIFKSTIKNFKNSQYFGEMEIGVINFQ